MVRQANTASNNNNNSNNNDNYNNNDKWALYEKTARWPDKKSVARHSANIGCLSHCRQARRSLAGRPNDCVAQSIVRKLPAGQLACQPELAREANSKHKFLCELVCWRVVCVCVNE